MKLSSTTGGNTIVPAAVFLLLLALVVGTWNFLRETQSADLRRDTSIVTEQLAFRLGAHIASRLAAGEHIRQHWLESGEPASRKSFSTDTRHLLTLFPDIQAINWVDAAGVIRWVTPEQGNRAAEGLNVRDHPVAWEALIKAEQSGAPQMTPPLTLAQGGRGMASYFPITRGNRLEGFINVVFRVGPIVETILNKKFKDNYLLRIDDDDQEIFALGSVSGTDPQIVQRPLYVLNRFWVVSVIPNPTRLASSLHHHAYILVLGIALSVGVAWMLRLSMVRRAALTENKRRFQDFAGAASDYFWEMDENLRFSYFSDRFAQVTGVQPEQLFGKTRRETGIPDVETEVWENHIADLEAHRPFRNFEHPRKKTDGSIVYLSISGTPVFDESGRLEGYRGTGTDVTERKRFEQELLDSREDLERQRQELADMAENLATARDEAENANRAKSEFLANMSHELRTPLNAIIGFSEMMTNEILGPLNSAPYKEYAHDISASGNHLLSLINDILDLSKIEAGKLELEEEIVDLASLVEASIRLVQPKADEVGLALAVEIAPGLPALRADERALKQILLNLLSNAVKFTEADGRVTVTAEIDPGGDLTISVADNGIGMAAEDIPRAFASFGQIHSTYTRERDGTGLGLPMVKALTELHGGSLGLDSVPGVGTTATVRLPRERVVNESLESSG